MANFLDFLRMHNIFGPQQPIGNDLPSQGGFTGMMATGPTATTDPYMANAGPIAQAQTMGPTDPSQSFDIDQYINSHYQPEHEATDKFTALMNAYPKREDYKPSLLRKIGASLAAVGSGYSHQDPRVHGFQFNPVGVKIGRDIMDEPFANAQEDWAKQIVPAREAANLERYSNANARQLATQSATDVLKQREQTMKDENAKARIRIADYKAKGVKSFDFKGPTVLAAYPDGHVEDTGIKTGHLNDQDKIDANTASRLEVVGAQGANAANVAQINQAGQDTRSWGQPYEVTLPDGTKKYMQTTTTGTGETREVSFPGGSSVQKIGGPQTGKGQQMENIKQKTQETLDALNELIDEKGKLKGPAADAVGASRMLGLQYLPATQTRAGDVAIKRLKSMLIVDLIGEMKAQSRTGATGFGQLNMKELGVLENAASKLDPALDEQTFTNELLRIKERLKKILQPESGLTNTTTVQTPNNDEIDALIAQHTKKKGVTQNAQR